MTGDALWEDLSLSGVKTTGRIDDVLRIIAAHNLTSSDICVLSHPKNISEYEIRFLLICYNA